MPFFGYVYYRKSDYPSILKADVQPISHFQTSYQNSKFSWKKILISGQSWIYYLMWNPKFESWKLSNDHVSFDKVKFDTYPKDWIKKVFKHFDKPKRKFLIKWDQGSKQRRRTETKLGRFFIAKWKLPWKLLLVVAGKAPEVVGKTWKKSWKAIQAKSLYISDTICISSAT